MKQINALFIAANPDSTTWLKLDEEARAIKQKIRASDYRDFLKLDYLIFAQTSDMVIEPP